MSCKTNEWYDEGGISSVQSNSAFRHNRSKVHALRAQSSMILIIIVLMMFVAIAVFLLQVASTVSNQEYTVLYANSLLLTVMRTDTGYTDSRCKLVSDLVVCACFTPTWRCGDIECAQLANETLAGYMDVFGNQTTHLKYLFTSTSQAHCIDSEGNSMALEIGDKTLKKSRETFKVFSYPLTIPKTFDYNSYIMTMQLIIANK